MASTPNLHGQREEVKGDNPYGMGIAGRNPELGRQSSAVELKSNAQHPPPRLNRGVLEGQT